MHRLVRYVWILFIPGTFVVFGAVRFPVAQAHPAEVVLTAKALHMITAAVLFDAYVTFGAILCMGTYVIGRFAIVGAFGQPLLDHLAVGRRMIVHAT